MADEKVKPKPKGGCLTRLAVFFILLTLGGFAVALYFVSRPQSLADVDSGQGEPVRDISVTLKESLERGFPVTLKEGEINSWIAQHLVAKQGGLFSGAASIDAVKVRLEEGVAEIIVARTVFGHPLTTSLYVTVQHSEGVEGPQKELKFQAGPYDSDFPGLLKGGRFGRLVVPQGFMKLVFPEYEKLAAALAPELEQGFQEMAKIEIRKDKLILDPIPAQGAVKLPGVY